MPSLQKTAVTQVTVALHVPEWKMDDLEMTFPAYTAVRNVKLVQLYICDLIYTEKKSPDKTAKEPGMEYGRLGGSSREISQLRDQHPCQLLLCGKL
ncbi:hypothetical protein SAMD00079811_27120 [Scytonema sp. HK-05]|nr:hypothetical protein SAMD00079811_27120 [Scytonema sp. HK-05]